MPYLKQTQQTLLVNLHINNPFILNMRAYIFGLAALAVILAACNMRHRPATEDIIAYNNFIVKNVVSSDAVIERIANARENGASPIQLFAVARNADAHILSCIQTVDEKPALNHDEFFKNAALAYIRNNKRFTEQLLDIWRDTTRTLDDMDNEVLQAIEEYSRKFGVLRQSLDSARNAFHEQYNVHIIREGETEPEL